MLDTRRDTAQWGYRLLTWIGAVLVALTIVFLLVLPTFFSWLIRSEILGRHVVEWMGVVEPIQIGLMHGLTFAWMFYLGGCFASFLNVVAWRVPRGRAITGSSHCPACDQRLSFWDNLPVVGWLRNGGRCRQCEEPISVRYLLAEVVLGTIFVVLGSVVLLTGGANWPVVELPGLIGFEHLLFAPNWFVIGVLAWHLTLLCFLFTFTLIESDRLPVPGSIMVAAIIVAVGVSFFAPHVWLVAWNQRRFVVGLADQPGLTLFLGGAVGGAVGCLIRWATTNERMPSALPASFLLVGMFLGWQATLSVGTLTLGLCVMVRLGMANAKVTRWFGPTACTLIATVLHLLCWRILYGGQ